MLSLLLMPLLFAPFFMRDVASSPALADLLIISALMSALLMPDFSPASISSL